MQARQFLDKIMPFMD